MLLKYNIKRNSKKGGKNIIDKKNSKKKIKNKKSKKNHLGAGNKRNDSLEPMLENNVPASQNNLQLSQPIYSQLTLSQQQHMNQQEPLTQSLLEKFNTISNDIYSRLEDRNNENNDSFRRKVANRIHATIDQANIDDPCPILQALIRDDDCAICLEPLKNNTTITFDCNHTFHEDCIINWAANKPIIRCPLCRKDITDEVVNKTGISRIDSNQQHSQSQEELVPFQIINENQEFLDEQFDQLWDAIQEYSQSQPLDSSQQLSQELPQQPSQELPQQLSQELPQQPSQELPQQPSQELPQQYLQYLLESDNNSSPISQNELNRQILNLQQIPSGNLPYELVNPNILPPRNPPPNSQPPLGNIIPQDNHESMELNSE